MSANTHTDVEDRHRREISVTVNGENIVKKVEPRLKLSDFLRDVCDCHGVRVGCEHGVCGACTVEMDGKTVKSCLVYAVRADGSDLLTVEGLSDDGELGPIQQAFHEEHALQCGFCTSGFLMATRSLLQDNPDPDDDDIRAGLADNICRCTGYQNIYDAVHKAADNIEEGAE